MAKDQRKTLLNSIFSTELYQRKQGRMMRRSTAGAIFLACVLASQAFYHAVLYDLVISRLGLDIRVAYAITGLVNVVGAWLAFRIVNYPVFADFLIDVESEMTKVTWPSWDELRRATVVVLGTMFIFSALLFGYDLAWQEFLKLTGILRVSP